MAARGTSAILALSAFVVGMGVMAIEITASRLLAPHFGASLFVWTSLIVTVLLAMSAGYWAGGIVAAKSAGMKALGVILCAAAAMLMGGMLIVRDLAGALSGIFLAWTDASATLFAGSLLVSFVVFALPVFLLAAAGPIILKEWSKLGGDVGRTAGRYFAVSTFGSVIGTLAPTLVLVPSIGAKNTVAFFAAVFLALGAVLLGRKEKRLFALLAVPALGMSLLGLLPSRQLDIIAQRESPYQLIRVRQDGAARQLIFNEGAGVQSVYDPTVRRSGYYFDFGAVLPLLRPYDPSTHKAAIIGLAGGSVARAYFNYLGAEARPRITGVEIDPEVIDIGRQYFGLDELGLDIVNQDGRVFLATTDEFFDVIVVDAYSTQLYIPPHMSTREFYALAKGRLKPGGILMMNINAAGESSRLLRALTNSAAASFGRVTIMPAGAWNYLVFASDEPLDLAGAAALVPDEDFDIKLSMTSAFEAQYDPSGEVFTDDRAPVEMLTDSMILAEVFKK